MATYYLRGLNSTVVSATATVDQLSATLGTTASAGTSVKNAKNANNFVLVPGVASSTAVTAIPQATPSSRGWIFDSSVAGTYAAGTWTLTAVLTSTSASGTADLYVNAWIVTATTTAVTSVAAIASGQTANFTPSLTTTAYTATFSPGAVTLAAGQYLYIELYLDVTVAGSSNTGTESIRVDSPSGLISQLVTPTFTAARALSQSLTSSLTPTATVSIVQTLAPVASLTTTTSQKALLLNLLGS